MLTHLTINKIVLPHLYHSGSLISVNILTLLYVLAAVANKYSANIISISRTLPSYCHTFACQALSGMDLIYACNCAVEGFTSLPGS